MTVVQPLRVDLEGFSGYRSARSEESAGDCRLDANEASSPNLADPGGELRPYPDPQPAALRGALARLYGCAPASVLLGRGSDEAIDLLVRATCPPGAGAIVVAPPVFGMYAVCARLHGVRVVEVPLCDGTDDFRADLRAMGDAALATGAQLVFLCSPGNPAGGVVRRDDAIALARRLQGRAMLVVDEAYVEFADASSLAGDVAAQPNLVVLRTLSKAHALAGARIGCAVAEPRVVAALRRCQAPYPVPTPVARAALAALAPDALAATGARVAETRAVRDALAAQLRALPGVRRVYPSSANFLLVRFEAVDAALTRLARAGIVVRDMRGYPMLRDALRITVGSARAAAAVTGALATGGSAA